MASSVAHNQGFHEARAIARRRRTRILLPAAVLLIMLAALLGIAVYDYRAMRNDVLMLSRGVIENLQSRIETEIEAYLQPIDGIIFLARDLFRARGDERLSRKQSNQVGISILRNTPQLTALYAGDPMGQFRMARRIDDGDTDIEVKYIQRVTTSKSGFENVITRHATDGTIQLREVQPWDGYDPRTRPWYKGAVEAGDLYWTDVYPFFTSQAAGITAAYPNLDDQGNLSSVVGVDVTLNDISGFLASLTIGKTGIALIIDDNGRLIAHPQAKLLRMDAGGNQQLTRVADLGDPIVRRAFDHYRVEGHGRRDFELDGRRYISSVSSLNHLLDRDWSILVVVPEDDFVGFVIDNISKTLVLGLSVLGLAALLAAVLIRQGLKTDREALRILERQALLDAEERAFVRLASKGRETSDPADPYDLRTVTETVAEATGSRRVSVWSLSDDARSLHCEDCFDRDSVGHTQGARIDAHDHPLVFEALRNADTIEVHGGGHESDKASLLPHYLEPLGCDSLFGAPIALGGTTRGALWLEDRRTAPWADEMQHFLHAVAALIALRGFGGRTASPAQVEHTSGTDITSREDHSRSMPGEHDVETDTSLTTRRAEAFTAQFQNTPDTVVADGAGIIDRLPVMVLRLTDPLVLARPAHEDDSKTTLAYLLRELQNAASAQGIGHLKFLSNQVVASTDPEGDCHEGIRHLVRYALYCKQLCQSVLAQHHAPLAFRIGIDLGPAIGALVGVHHPRFVLWGEAVQTATEMADSSLAGAIQVTETVYAELHDQYLLQLRGHHYLERLGEFSTYLLSEHL